MSEKDDWPTANQIRRPDPNAVKEAVATYARVARNELPPEQRPEFRIPPEDRLRRIYRSEG